MTSSNHTKLNLNFSKSYLEEFWVNKCEIHCVLCDSDCSRDCGLSWKCPLCESVVTDNDNSVVTRAENFHFDCVEVTGVQIIKFVLVLQSEKQKRKKLTVSLTNIDHVSRVKVVDQRPI